MNRQMQPFFGIFAATLAVTLLGAASVPSLPVPKGAAVILNPGNGDYSGFRIVVSPDGKAAAVDAAGRASNELSTSVAQQFFDDLSAAANASQSGKSCASGSGLATTTVQINSAVSIAWNGRQWWGLECTSDARISKLAADANAIERALYVQAYRERTVVVYLGNSTGYATPAYQVTGASGYSGFYGGPFNAGQFSLYRVSTSPYSGYPAGSLPGGGLPTTSLSGGLPAANLPTTNPYSGLPSASLSSSSPYSGSPYGSSPYSGGP